MNWKQYQNEGIVIVAFLLLFASWFYKQAESNAQLHTRKGVQQELTQFKELIELKKIWGDPKTGKRVEKLKRIVNENKVKWQKSAKKLTVSFSDLNGQEVNKVVTKILNLPIEIKSLQIEKTGTSYHVECQCKW